MSTYDLEFKWSTSRARDSYGYNVCRLMVNGEKVARTCGGGYDMQGTVLGDWVAKAFEDRLRNLTPEDMPPNSHWDGQKQKTVKTGHYFYGLTFHDPNFNPGKAVIGEGCTDRTLSKDNQDGKTVEQAEEEGASLGLERYQAFYTASSKVPTERHTVPLIDGACGLECVVKIMKAINLEYSWTLGRRRDDQATVADHGHVAAAAYCV